MFKALLVLLVFVAIATMLAGISKAWGQAMVALMLAFLALQALTHGIQFARWAGALNLQAPHPTAPVQPTGWL